MSAPGAVSDSAEVPTNASSEERRHRAGEQHLTAVVGHRGPQVRLRAHGRRGDVVEPGGQRERGDRGPVRGAVARHRGGSGQPPRRGHDTVHGLRQHGSPPRPRRDRRRGRPPGEVPRHRGVGHDRRRPRHIDPPRLQLGDGGGDRRDAPWTASGRTPASPRRWPARPCRTRSGPTDRRCPDPPPPGRRTPRTSRRRARRSSAPAPALPPPAPRPRPPLRGAAGRNPAAGPARPARRAARARPRPAARRARAGCPPPRPAAQPPPPRPRRPGRSRPARRPTPRPTGHRCAGPAGSTSVRGPRPRRPARRSPRACAPPHARRPRRRAPGRRARRPGRGAAGRRPPPGPPWRSCRPPAPSRRAGWSAGRRRPARWNRRAAWLDPSG